MGLYCVARNVKGDGHLLVGAGGQEFENTYLGSGQWRDKPVTGWGSGRLCGTRLDSRPDQLFHERIWPGLCCILDQVTGHLGCGGDDGVEEPCLAGCVEGTGQDAVRRIWPR